MYSDHWLAKCSCTFYKFVLSFWQINIASIYTFSHRDMEQVPCLPPNVRITRSASFIFSKASSNGIHLLLQYNNHKNSLPSTSGSFSRSSSKRLLQSGFCFSGSDQTPLFHLTGYSFLELFWFPLVLQLLPHWLLQWNSLCISGFIMHICISTKKLSCTVCMRTDYCYFFYVGANWQYSVILQKDQRFFRGLQDTSLSVFWKLHL